MVALLVFIIANLEVAFGRKKLLDAKGPFGDNVIKTDWIFFLRNIYQQLNNFKALKIFFDTMLDGLLAIIFRFKSNLLNNIYHTEGVFLFGESKFSRFRVRKECETRNWICNLCDPSQTRSI